MKDLGELHHFLGMQVQRTPSGLFLSQHQYMLDILDRAGMAACKPCSTPVDLNPKLSADGDPISDPTDFRSLAGALQYLTFTRPDIAYAVQQVCLHTCMIRASLILQPSSGSFIMFVALLTWVFICVLLIRLSWWSTLMRIGPDVLTLASLP